MNIPNIPKYRVLFIRLTIHSFFLYTKINKQKVFHSSYVGSFK